MNQAQLLSTILSKVRRRSLLTTFVAVAAIVVCFVAMARNQRAAWVDDAASRGATSCAKMVAALIADPKVRIDAPTVESLLDRIAVQAEVTCVSFRDADGKTVAGRSPNGGRVSDLESLWSKVLGSGDARKLETPEAVYAAAAVQPAAEATSGWVLLGWSKQGGALAAQSSPWGELLLPLALIAAALVALRLCLGYVLAPISNVLSRAVEGVSGGARKIFEAASQLAKSSVQIASGATEQASKLQETSASLRQLSTSTRQNVANIEQSNGMTEETFALAETSRGAMNRLVNAMSLIKESANSMAKILNTIDTIAFQTNILALNAAVEAARAGDAGRGFAVVAGEVRNLARQSAEAASKTSSLIKESQKNAETGATASQEVETILSKIATRVRDARDLASRVASSSVEQAQGIDLITGAMVKLDSLTQMNAAKSQEAGSLSKVLFSEVKDLNDLVDDLGQTLSTGQLERGMEESLMTEAPEYAPAPSPAQRAQPQNPARPALPERQGTTLPRGASESHALQNPKEHRHSDSGSTRPGEPSHLDLPLHAPTRQGVRPEVVIPLSEEELHDCTTIATQSPNPFHGHPDKPGASASDTHRIRG